MSGRSAITEPGDGVMTVPPVLQPVTEIFSPLNSVQIPESPSSDTFLISGEQITNGASVVQQLNFSFFKAGRWDLHLFHTTTFLGTQNTASAFSVFLQHSGEGLVALSRYAFISTPAVRNFAQDFSFLFLDDNWRLFLQTDTTVALDAAVNFCSVYARRVF